MASIFPLQLLWLFTRTILLSDQFQLRAAYSRPEGVRSVTGASTVIYSHLDLPIYSSFFLFHTLDKSEDSPISQQVLEWGFKWQHFRQQVLNRL